MRNYALSENLIYRIDLEHHMRMILNFYWKPPKTVLDVTAGERKIWGGGWYNQVGLDNREAWHVDFCDISDDAMVDFVAHCGHLPVADFRYDILVFDPPFTKPENDSTLSGIPHRHNKTTVGGRNYYMRGFESIDKLCNDVAPEFNRVARKGLIVKIGDRHEDRKYINQHGMAIAAFEKYFTLVDLIGLRGNRPVKGSFLPFAANTLTFYLIFKKNVYQS